MLILKRFTWISLTLLLIIAYADAQTTGKAPVIIIPGISGSQLIDPRTGKTVWFSVKRGKPDDLRLPITSAALGRNRDGLRAGDIIRSVELPVLPDVEVYQTLIDALIAHGYTEALWSKPKAADAFYVFPYDWRQDNVETAHLLLRKIAAAKAILRRPDLKFDILAHSMGGLIARYAAMYGMADLSGAAPLPTWAGAAHIDKLMMFGTPNEGSFGAFEAITTGYPLVAGRNLPLIDDLRPEDVFTLPSMFQLLPHQSSARFYDGDLKPVNIDLYDVATWEKYGWGALGDVNFLAKLKDAPRLAIQNKEIKPVPLAKGANADDRLIARTTYWQVRAYVSSALNRAKRFQAALDAPVKSTPIRLFAYGGNCQPTLDGVVLVRDEKKERWLTLVDARDMKTSAGREIKKDEVKAVMFSNGDGEVTQRSLLASLEQPSGSQASAKPLLLEASFFGCSSHTKLFLEKPIQDSFLSALVMEEQKQP